MSTLQMQKFARLRSSAELKAKLATLGICLKMREYKRGSDFVSFKFSHGKGRGTCVFSAWNGRFFGTFYPARGEEISFTSDTDKHDSKGWMKKLLNICYTNDPVAKVKP